MTPCLSRETKEIIADCFTYRGRRFFGDKPYRPTLEIHGDNDTLAEHWQRVMFRHDLNGPEFFVAPIGIVSAGWVIGLVVDS